MASKSNSTARSSTSTESKTILQDGGGAPTDKKKHRHSRKKVNRRSAVRAASVMIALDNPRGIRWVMEFAPIYATILHGIEAGLTSRGCQMQVCSIRSQEEFESLVTHRPPDGLLFLASKNVVSLKDSIGSIPCVSVLGNPCSGHFDQVTYDNPATGQLAANLFINNSIHSAAILGPTEPGRSTTFGVRYTSFCTAMADANAEVLPLLSDQLYEPGNPFNQPRPEEIERLIQILKQKSPLPKGLFVMADNLLPSVYAHLAKAGIMPGTDLHVISCNSESPYFAALSPEPARVDIPAEEIGQRAVELLEWRTHNPGKLTTTTTFTPAIHIPAGCSIISRI